jgi:hypothetical protein
MMNRADEKREYIVHVLNTLGSVCPARYAQMLSGTPTNGVIENLSPWAFLPDPERSSRYTTEALGYPVLPFAQAVEEDLVACFVSEPSTNPEVIVINPWSDEKAAMLKAELRDFEAWLAYAEQISREVQARQADEEND